MKLSNVKISSHIISYSASTFLMLKRFDRHNVVILFTVTIFCCIMPNWGYKAKTGGTIAPPGPT